MIASRPPVHACEAAFARGLGFDDYLDLISVSQPTLSPVGELWFLAELPNQRWLAWPFPEYDGTHIFDSYSSASEFVRPTCLA